jgi:WD40 repeat protein
MLATTGLILAAMFAMRTESPKDNFVNRESPENRSAEAQAPETSGKTEKSANSGPRRLRQFAAPGDVQTIACSADGKLVAIANGNPTMILLGNGRSRVEGDWRPSAIILDSQTGETLVSLSVTSPEEEKLLEAAERAPHFEIEALAFSPDASVLAIGTNAGQVKLFKARTGELVRSLDDGQGKLTDQETPEEFHSLPRAMGKVDALAFSPDGSLLATCGGSFGDFPVVPARIERGGLAGKGTDRLKVWDVKSGTLKHTLVGHRHAHAVAFSPDGKLLASAGRWDGSDRGNGVILWNPESGTKVRALSTPANGGTHSIAFSPDGKLLAIGSIVFDKDKDTDAASGLITLARAGSGLVEWQRSVPGWAKPVVFSPDGKSVVVLHGRQTIMFINAETGATQSEINAGDSRTETRWNDIAISPSARTLAIGGVDKDRKGIVELWELGRLDAAEADSPKATKLLRERVALIFEALKSGNATVDEAVRACKDLAEVEPAEATRRLKSLLEIAESFYKDGLITKTDLLSVQAAYELAKERAK